MTSFQTQTFLFLFLFSLIACDNDDDKPIQYSENQTACRNVDLGIDESAKRLREENEVFFVIDTVWQWHREGNDLEIEFSYGCGDECSSTRRLDFVLQDSCVVLANDVITSSDVYDGDDTTENQIDFQLQSITDLKIVGKNGETEFWVDFNENNKY